MSAPQAILARGLVKRFGAVTALDGLDLAVDPGTITGLLGPNGAGKTTAIEILTTVRTADAGTATVAGYDVHTDPAAVRAAIGVAGQVAALDETFSARENLVLFGRLHGLRRAIARRRAEDLLVRCGLADAADRRVATYSGGMRRRVDLAAAMMGEPAVLFLDEPTTGLDPASRAQLWDLVRERRAAGAAILLTTQYLEEADELADRIVVLRTGQVVAEGTAAQLKDRVGGAVCRLLVTDPQLRARVGAALVEVGPVTAVAGGVSVPATGPQTLVRVVQALDRHPDLMADPGLIDDIALRRPTLDEVFLRLTGNDTGHDNGSAAAGDTGSAAAGDTGHDTTHDRTPVVP